MTGRRTVRAAPSLRTALAGVLLGMLGLAACAPADRASSGTDGDPTANSSGAAASGSASPRARTGRSGQPSDPGSSGSSGSATAPADPDHAVEPPGPREGPIYADDMLVFSRESLSDEMVRQVQSLPGVAATLQISMAQVAVEDRVYNIAAVDPGRYRNYTVQQAADAQEVWDRVAGGELAIEERLGKRLVDRDGYVKLGNDRDAPRVHVGAYAPQVDQVAAVVNEKWGETLGMIEGNALLVTTGSTAPESIRPKIARIVGETASILFLAPELDITATQTAFLTGGSVAEAVGTFNYRVIGGGRIAPDPAWVAANIRTEPVPILGSVTCHRAMIPQFRAALEEIVQRGLADEIHPGEYAGCYYPRFIAGSTQLSLHSFGIAFDVNVPGNQRGTVGEIDRDVVAIFKKWGFSWGGDWSWTDPMHFEMSSIVEPR